MKERKRSLYHSAYNKAREATTTGRHCAHEFSKIEYVSIFLHSQQKYLSLWRTVVLLPSVLDFRSSSQGLAYGKLFHTCLLTLPLVVQMSVASSRMMEHCF